MRKKKVKKYNESGLQSIFPGGKRDFIYPLIRSNIEIGQTLETNDLFLPHKKQPNSKSRPVIVVAKNKYNDYAVVPGSKQLTRNTRPYNKYGIKNYRNNVEIVDNEGKPIKRNKKFLLTQNCSKLPKKDVEIIYDKVVNHSRFSSENRKKMRSFYDRKKR